jgi:hypothetical protein
MKADEIRTSTFEHDDGAWESARWLREIAAQLAEFNQRFDSLIETNHKLERIASALEGLERR